MPLSKNEKIDLASRINSMVVCGEMVVKLLNQGKTKTAILFQEDYFRDILYIHDTYGIKLPAYPVAKNWSDQKEFAKMREEIRG